MRETFPTEDELVEEMAKVLSPLEEHRCVVRLMDIGGDKELPFLESFSESNPFLGRRGIRLLFNYPKLLKVQLRALIQLSKNLQIQIMVPMVTVADDMKQVFICGELAGRLDAIPALLNAGIQMLSVAPPLIPSVKQTVRKIE